jgi:hypothetical protein
MVTDTLLDEIVKSDNLKIVPFRWYHPRSMDLRDFDLVAYQEMDDYEGMLRYYEIEPFSFTAILDGKMVACFGSHILWDGVSESWLIGSKQLNSVPITLTRMCRRYLDVVARELQLNRMQITCNTKDELAVRWAIALKFEREGLLRHYGPCGSDYIMFSRIYDERFVQSQNA